ncbi:MAG: BREX system Lon protease-like protein BrxL [Muribaculaceae bacterium]|nr:BREX system Lon protease-like protein BrxL [Muribaculaceae bacterium]
MDRLDIKLNEAFPGKVVRKDLLHDLRKTSNVPSFVLEFFLSKYCASEDPEEIEEGKKAVQQTIEKHYVHSDDSNRAQSMVEQKNRHKFIDKIHVRYVEREKRYWAEMENFGSKRIAINPRFYQENEKLLEAGVWAEITLAYNEVEEDDYAFYVEDLRPIQIAHFDVERFKKGREAFTTEEWIDVLIRSIGIDPKWLEERSRHLKGDKDGKRLKYHILSRFLPMVQNNYNSIELGGRSTGKSYFYAEFSPYSTLLSGGQASTATLLYNNQRKQVGAVGFWDTIAFDEVANMKIKDADTIQIMKDYMANGRFSRGTSVTAYASFAFVGNFDLNIPTIVNSYDHDLLATLPKAFDLAVIDRLFNYIPGWEIPKIDEESYTTNYGLITDYLAEYLAYAFKHSSEYTAIVREMLKKGDNIEGRDDLALQKTILGFVKLLWPSGRPTPEEFDEVVEYALEGRRRVKEQLNKRKPDEEYARIDMSYINSKGEKVVVYCPESKYSEATQNPRRQPDVEVRVDPEITKDIDSQPPVKKRRTRISPTDKVENTPVAEDPTKQFEGDEPKPGRKELMHGDIGYDYETLYKDYLKGAKVIQLEEPYLSMRYQMENLTRFVEMLIKIGDCRSFTIYTKPCDRPEDTERVRQQLQQLSDTIADMETTDMRIDFKFDGTMHDRCIRTDTGWRIDTGRGLHIYQNLNPDRERTNPFQMGTYDLSLRPTHSTTITYTKI